MDAFVIALLSNPLYYIGAALALAAAVGMLLFFWGLASGIGNLFHMHGHDEHLHHARIRIVQGLYLSMVVLGIWQLIRIAIGEAPPSAIILVLVLLTPVWIPWLTKLMSGGGGGH